MRKSICGVIGLAAVTVAAFAADDPPTEGKPAAAVRERPDSYREKYGDYKPPFMG